MIPTHAAVTRYSIVAAAAFALALGLACSDLPPAPEGAGTGAVSLAKGGGGNSGGGETDVTVTATKPDTASQGTTLDVTISGGGFTADMEATWELDGVADPSQVRTNSTRYVSSKQLVANITVGGEARPDKWDIRVTRIGGGKGGIGIELFEVKLSDPATTWKIPLTHGSGLRSDGKFAEAGYSIYADRICGVEGTILATTAHSNSGDATIKTGNPGKKQSCSRAFTLQYPDGFIETLTSFNNLRQLQNTSYSIPVGATVNRMLGVNPGVLELSGNSSSRCGRLLFGENNGPNGLVGAGSDSVQVTRLDASTWHVQSQGAHNAWCEKTGQLFVMPVDFVIVASYDLP